MREKELRLALVCYGGISLAVYMHGITKEIWHAARASRAAHDADMRLSATEEVYRQLIADIEMVTAIRTRVFVDIIAGASAGGINGVFLAQAIATGQSLDPLTDLWLSKADVNELLDPDARPLSGFTKFWAVPIAWAATKRQGNVIDRTVEAATQEEVRDKVSQFVRARWFEPPFGGKQFSGMLLDAFDAMAKSLPEGEMPRPLVPPEQPLDLIVTVTDFAGYPQRMELHSPAEVIETEHRLTLNFRYQQSTHDALGDIAGLTFAARATASFPGAFPPFTVRELDAVLEERDHAWPQRDDFLTSQLPRQSAIGSAEDTVLIDGSVLANAPFGPAIDELRGRPARREVDRRIVYIDPKPDLRSIRMTAKRGEDGSALPGFFTTIFGAMSDIPREQPIRDNVEMIAGRSSRIRRMRRIIDAMREEVDERVQKLFGRTLFLDRPTVSRLASWRSTAQKRAADAAGFAYVAYGHLKLSGIVEDLAVQLCGILGLTDSRDREHIRQAVWTEIRARGLDQISGPHGDGASDAVIHFFRSFDLGFRIRRLRFLARRLDEAIEAKGEVPEEAVSAMREAIYSCLALYFERQSRNFFDAHRFGHPDTAASRIGELLMQLERDCDLAETDSIVDARMTEALAALPKTERREMLLSYLGFPYYDIATLPLLQGEGSDEYDPIKVDRISPNDASAIRQGGAQAILKGIQFNSFGAFFSRSYRENDYLWGRLHGAERMLDIIASTMPAGKALPPGRLVELRRTLFHAILDEEEPRLTAVSDLIAGLRKEIGAEG